MCYQLNASDDIDDAIEVVFNVNVAISRVGFVGSKAQQAYALSNVHGLQLWNLGAEEILVDIDDLRPACSQAVSCQMDYVIDCKYDADKDALYVVAGSDVGHVAAYQLAPGIGPIAVMAAFEANAHSQVVRTFEWETRSGHFWSGGEDCKVCLWEVAGGGRGGGATAAAAATESACAMPPVVGFLTTASGVKMEMEGGDDEEEKVEEVVEWGYEMVKKSEEDMWASWKGPSDGLDLSSEGLSTWRRWSRRSGPTLLRTPLGATLRVKSRAARRVESRSRWRPVPGSRDKWWIRSHLRSLLPLRLQ